MEFKLKWFSLELRKIKTKVVTLANHNRRKQYNQPIRELKSNTCRWLQAGETVCEQVTIGFSFISDRLRKWREIF